MVVPLLISFSSRGSSYHPDNLLRGQIILRSVYDCFCSYYLENSETDLSRQLLSRSIKSVLCSEKKKIYTSDRTLSRTSNYHAILMEIHRSLLKYAGYRHNLKHAFILQCHVVAFSSCTILFLCETILTVPWYKS